MEFGEIAVNTAIGAILAHSVQLDGQRFAKGRVLSAGDIAALQQAGIAQVVAARLTPDDMPEDEAAAALAHAAAGTGVDCAAPFTGRANLSAACDGLALVDTVALDRFNMLDESLTIATVAPFEPVVAGQMIATVKIIPFAAPRAAVARGETLLRELQAGLLQVAPWRAQKVGLVSTFLPDGKQSLLEKNRKGLEGRLAALGRHAIVERRCPHKVADVAAEITALRDAGCSLICLFGASAIVDRRDVLPAAIAQAGGAIEHFGMPVDPGNLLLLGRHGEVPVIGLPGCARSPKLNGFDWVLQRLVAGLRVRAEDIMKMGGGGLLKEIVSRPQPRAGGKAAVRKAPKIAAIILAAGQSRRMGAVNKLLTEIDGEPLITRIVRAVVESKAGPIVLVTGHEADRVRAAVADFPLTLVHNRDYADGLSGSLKAGLSALGAGVDGAIICLGDMPELRADHLARLIAAFDPEEGREICVPTFEGKRGNPVLFGRRFFPEMMQVSGDVGARHLIGEYAEAVCEVPSPDRSIFLDLDTPEALAAYRNNSTS